MRALAAAALLALTVQPAAAVEVDVELVLLADTTGSIDQTELVFQRDGYAQAIIDPRVISAIRNTLTGSIALTYVEFGDSNSQHVVVPWMVIDGEASAQAFAAALDDDVRMAYGRNGFGAALLRGKALIEGNDIDSMRKVIDFSADSSTNRTGISIAEARARVLDAGIVINGLAVLCLMCEPSAGYRAGSLVEEFERTIIGGPGSFVVAAETADQFVEAVRRKLILEISGIAAAPRMAQAD